MNADRRFTLPMLILFAALDAALLGGCATGPGAGPGGSLFYPAPPQRPRIQFLAKFAGAEDLEGEPSALMKFVVGDMSSRRRFRKPTGIATIGGVIYVADPGWDTVLVLDFENSTFDTLGDRGQGKLRVPVAIATDEAGNKFVADTGRNQVVQFNAENEFVRAFGNPNKLRPSGVAVDDDYVYVANRAKHEVLVLDRLSKETVRRIGEFGKRDGRFNIPTSVSLDPNGHLFVTDVANFRVQEFEPSGEFVQSYGFLGDGPGTFARPKGVAVDRDGHLYVVDAAFENIQVWDTSNAQVLLAFGGPGVGPGNLYLPASLAISYELNPHFERYVDPDFNLEYVIVVANNYGPNKVAVYGFVTPKDPSRYPEYSLPDDEEDEE